MVNRAILRYTCVLLMFSLVVLFPVRLTTAQVNDDGDRFLDDKIGKENGYETDHHWVGWYSLTSSGTIVPLTWNPSNTTMDTLFSSAINYWINAGLRPDLTFQKVSNDPILSVVETSSNFSCGGAPACFSVDDYSIDTLRNMTYWYLGKIMFTPLIMASPYDANDRQYAMNHEVGHLLGLHHHPLSGGCDPSIVSVMEHFDDFDNRCSPVAPSNFDSVSINQYWRGGSYLPSRFNGQGESEGLSCGNRTCWYYRDWAHADWMAVMYWYTNMPGETGWTLSQTTSLIWDISKHELNEPYEMIIPWDPADVGRNGAFVLSCMRPFVASNSLYVDWGTFTCYENGALDPM